MAHLRWSRHPRQTYTHWLTDYSGYSIDFSQIFCCIELGFLLIFVVILFYILSFISTVQNLGFLSKLVEPWLLGSRNILPILQVHLISPLIKQWDPRSDLRLKIRASQAFFFFFFGEIHRFGYWLLLAAVLQRPEPSASVPEYWLLSDQYKIGLQQCCCHISTIFHLGFLYNSGPAPYF